MTIPARRGAHGHYLPGISGNPGGRTSALTEVRALLKPHVALYVERLNELVRNPDPEVALPALREALDRLLGKPVQSVEQDVRTLNIPALFVEALMRANEPPTIEGEATGGATAANSAGQRRHHVRVVERKVRTTQMTTNNAQRANSISRAWRILGDQITRHASDVISMSGLLGARPLQCGQGKSNEPPHAERQTGVPATRLASEKLAPAMR